MDGGEYRMSSGNKGLTNKNKFVCVGVPAATTRF